jgi:glycosyltransferase involved in cell wall biosynthesis
VAYIGGRSGYKNFAVLLQAIAISVGKGEPLRLKVIGQPLSKSEQKTMTQLGIGQLVVEVVNPPSIDEALEDCFAVVSTSLAEGFGLVSLEAGKRRIPLVSSDIPVMREILGDAALYFPPKDPLRLHEMLLRLLESTDEYFERAAAMFRATERYSVEKMATETMTVYHQVAQEEAGRRRAR